MADPSSAIVVIGGANVTRFARVGRVRIDDVLNDAPNTAALTIVFETRRGAPESGAFAPHAFDPVAFQTVVHMPVLKPPPIPTGAPIQIYTGTIAPASQIFGGEITTREQYAELNQAQHVRFDLGCIDFSRALNRRKVTKNYATLSATAIVLDLVATFAPAITTANVAAGLPSISGGITFTWEEMSRALSRIAEKIGAYWYVDYVGDLHFFTGTEAGASPAPIIPGADFTGLKITADLTQVRTRVFVEGDGATVSATISAGDPIVPVSQTLPFNPAGGRATLGPLRITYSGLHAGAAKTNTAGVSGPATGASPPPTAPAAPVAAVASATTAGALAGGPYQYAATFELGDGTRSDLGAPSAPVTIGTAGNPPSTAAGLFAPPVKGPIVVGVASTYATSFLDGTGRETAATTGGNSLTGRAVADPVSGGASYTSRPGGAMEIGQYQYAVTYMTAAGETLPAIFAPVYVNAVGSQTVRIGIPVAADSRVAGRRIYRSTMAPNAGPPPLPAALPWRHVVDVPNNTQTTYDDGAADSTLPTKNYPAFSTATDVGEAAQIAVPVSTDARVVRRRLYRKDGAGEYRLVAEIPDNVTAAFNDVTLGPGGNLAPKGGAILGGAINVSAIPLGPAGTVRRRVFRTTAGGTEYRELVAVNDNTTTGYLDVVADGNLGGSALPGQGAPASPGAPPPPAPAGSTTLQIDAYAGFPGSGWALVESQLIRYTGVSAAGGLQYLTGIPASGPGALTADVPVGSVVTASPALVGVSPVVALTLGDAVQLLAQVDDVPAQTALAAVEGGDGIIEHYIQDRRLSEAGARARGLAELALFKTIETRVAYSTHDVNTRSGRTVHVDLPAPTNLTGDFLIQRVTIDDVSIADNWYPRRTVDASTTRFSFDDVLARLLMDQT